VSLTLPYVCVSVCVLNLQRATNFAVTQSDALVSYYAH
jgi:hypothetical protein